MVPTETAELIGGPCDGDRLVVEPGHVEVQLWHRCGTVLDVDCRVTPKGLPESTMVLPRPGRHRYRRTGRMTPSGAAMFVYCGRLVGVGF